MQPIINGEIDATVQQIAILKLLACVNKRDVERVFRETEETHEWRTVSQFPKYQVSSTGSVRRYASGQGSLPGQVLKQTLGPNGRLRVTLYEDDGTMRTVQVHHLVCSAFHGPKPSKAHMVCHRDDDPSNNDEGNLYWGTAKQNSDDRVQNEARKMREAGFDTEGNGTKLAQAVKSALANGEISKHKARFILKKSMNNTLRSGAA